MRGCEWGMCECVSAAYMYIHVPVLRVGRRYN